MSKNSPKLWKNKIPKLEKSANKYTRGHAIICGGGVELSGAARLAAISALRTGAGLVTVNCSPSASIVYACQLTAVMLKSTRTISEFKEFITDERKSVFAIGMGAGVSKETEDKAMRILAAKKNAVIDADALTIFQTNPQKLFKAIKAAKSQIVLTPHEGEFKRLFKLGKDREFAAIAAAKLSGAVVVLKGAETIIANPQGEFVVNNNALPTLATAGSGDVLAGIITGLLAQGMNAFDAACAGAWIHAECANIFVGRGLISEDLPPLIPQVFSKILIK